MDISKLLTLIISATFFIICFMSGLILFGKMSVGWDKDCKEQIQNLSELDTNYPQECRDFSKYHIMLICSIGLMFMGMAVGATGFAMVVSPVQESEANERILKGGK